MIKIEHLIKNYGTNCAVDDISFTIKKGEIVGFIGPNGAGKSTTIRSIMNLINKTSGKVLIENKEFNKDDIKVILNYFIICYFIKFNISDLSIFFSYTSYFFRGYI